MCVYLQNYLKVNETLSDLAKATSDAKREEVLRRIRVDCSPMNQKWLVRVSSDYRPCTHLGIKTRRILLCAFIAYLLLDICCLKYERDGEGLQLRV